MPGGAGTRRLEAIVPWQLQFDVPLPAGRRDETLEHRDRVEAGREGVSVDRHPERAGLERGARLVREAPVVREQPDFLEIEFRKVSTVLGVICKA